MRDRGFTDACLTHARRMLQRSCCSELVSFSTARPYQLFVFFPTQNEGRDGFSAMISQRGSLEQSKSEPRIWNDNIPWAKLRAMRMRSEERAGTKYKRGRV